MEILDGYNKIVPPPYRQAADRIWEMAEEYKEKGLRDLSETLKTIAQEIHLLAREKSFVAREKSFDGNKDTSK
jgi:hypothetical protein